MEYPKEKGMNQWPSPRAQMDGGISPDGCTRNPNSEDVFNNFSELMNFDMYAGWCNSPGSMDHMLAPFGVSSFQSTSTPTPYASFDGLNFSEQNCSTIPGGDNSNAAGTGYSCGDKMSNTQFGYPLDSMDSDDHLAEKQTSCAQPQRTVSDMAHTMISKPLEWSLNEKMLKALSLLRESAGGGILAQVWVPVKQGDQYIMSTYEQPYLLDQMLAGYREVSRKYTFSAEMKPGLPLGLPGRVFTSRVPEWTSNVVYYSTDEYLRVNHAVDHKVQGSIALPIFEPPNMSCCAVLELVTVKEKPDFDSEMENVCLALQAVNLRSTAPPRLLTQSLSRNQVAALSEITDVLRAVCHAHRLPLALTWIPCSYEEESVGEVVKVRLKKENLKSVGKPVLCVQVSACYSSKETEGFVHACSEHYIEEGQGVAGKALQSNHPFFVPDVKSYNICEYPLVQHARKYNLSAAVSIRLRSTYTGCDDYILEFFLPVNMKGGSEQQLLLNNLSGTMQKVCKSLRTVSDAELAGGEGYKAEFQEGAVSCFPSMSVSVRNSQGTISECNLNSTGKVPCDASTSKNDGKESDSLHEGVNIGSRRPTEKKRSTAEKNVSLSVLQQYFSGSLKDAAKSIGVCPTTLKRICRQHGISRWPSRKINKVNRSLRKIQTVLDSVQGVDGGLRFDPTTGGFVAAGSIIQENDYGKKFIFPDKNLASRNSDSEDVSILPSPSNDGNNSIVKVEEDECSLDVYGIECAEESKSFAANAGMRKKSWAYRENSSIFAEGGEWHPNKNSMKLGYLNTHLVPGSSCSLTVKELNAKLQSNNRIMEHDPTCSSMTDSSNSSGSLVHGSISSSPSFEDAKDLKVKSICDDSGLKITVKAKYKEEAVRFKFEVSAGCFQLYEEVAKRFKLQNGTFQLRYLDDEEEWVMLMSDSDLQECVEILDSVGTRTVKFLVRDIPFTMGSSGSSNCFLG
ncbi:Plant regulator RWP-RK family protein [Euphorbia peplus]|nr:Plant regulator RWP-RK family protein [Euphorbia peplus]